MSKGKKIKIIISIAAISFIQGLQYCVSPVLGQIQEHYPDVNISLVQMLITAPALLSMIVAVLSGWLVLKISKKKLLLFASLVAGITGFLPYLSDSFGLLFFSRTFYGVGLGLATALNTAVVAEFFEGDERVSVMGIQAASVGAGMVVVTTVGGMLGAGGFKNAYLINVIGFISLILIACCLPDTGKAQASGSEKIQLNKEVFKISFLGMLEFLFLITFTTNIAMHLSGNLAGNTAVSGNLTGVFSGSQIVIGLILGMVTKITKKYTLPVAMLSFSIGGLLLSVEPDHADGRSSVLWIFSGHLHSTGDGGCRRGCKTSGNSDGICMFYLCNVFRSGNIANGSEYHLEAGIRRSFHYECIHHFRDWNDSSCRQDRQHEI